MVFSQNYSYATPEFEKIKEHNDIVIKNVQGYTTNLRKVQESKPEYPSLYKWTDLTIVGAQDSVDEYSLSDNMKNFIYWGWGEEHTKQVNKQEPAMHPCENKTNKYVRKALKGRMLYTASMKFKYYNVSKELPVALFYKVKILSDNNTYVYSLQDNDTGYKTYETFNNFEKTVFEDIYSKVSTYMTRNELNSSLVEQQIEKSMYEPLEYDCMPPQCTIRWYYYYINPVPVPFNQSEYNTLFMEKNEKIYQAEPWLNITLSASIKIRYYDNDKVYYWDEEHNKCIADRWTRISPAWYSKTMKTQKSYFIEQGDVEQFYITPVLSEEINHNPEIELIIFANRRMQRGIYFINNKTLTNYYMRKFYVSSDEFWFKHVQTKDIYITDFRVYDNDFGNDYESMVQHSAEINHSEQKCAPYQITYSGNSFRWVNYYHINFTEDDGQHNIVHKMCDIFGNNFILSKDIYLRQPTYIINKEVYANSKNSVAQVDKDGGRWNYYEGSTELRPCIAIAEPKAEHELQISLPDISIIISSALSNAFSNMFGEQK